MMFYSVSTAKPVISTDRSSGSDFFAAVRAPTSGWMFNVPGMG